MKPAVISLEKLLLISELNGYSMLWCLFQLVCDHIEKHDMINVVLNRPGLLTT